jgi:hypothetical protein
MPVGEVPARAAELSKPGTVATICEWLSLHAGVELARTGRRR